MVSLRVALTRTSSPSVKRMCRSRGAPSDMVNGQDTVTATFVVRSNAMSIYVRRRSDAIMTIAISAFYRNCYFLNKKKKMGFIKYHLYHFDFLKFI